jgi:hypothetical protein
MGFLRGLANILMLSNISITVKTIGEIIALNPCNLLHQLLSSLQYFCSFMYLLFFNTA